VQCDKGGGPLWVLGGGAQKLGMPMIGGVPHPIPAHPRESGDPGFLVFGTFLMGFSGSSAATKNTWVPAFAGMSGCVST
jgi:hypothetical protein